MEFYKLAEKLNDISLSPPKIYLRSQSLPSFNKDSRNSLNIPSFGDGERSPSSHRRLFKFSGFRSPFRSPNHSPIRSPIRSPARSPTGRLSPIVSPLQNKKKKSFLFSAKQRITRNRLSSSNRGSKKDRQTFIQYLEEEEDIDYFIKDFNSSFGSNSWYHGEITIICQSLSNQKSNYDENQNLEDDLTLKGDASQHCRNGSIIARVDEENNISCSIIFTFEDETYIEDIPCCNGEYCFDFSDEDQPRFSSINLVLAHLLQNKFIKRVTFSWLIQNGYATDL